MTAKSNRELKQTIQLNILEILGDIYSAVYNYEFSENNHLMIGLGYQNIHYDFGITHAPSIIVGYRRFIWKGLNAEIVLWPAYNIFKETNENKYYRGLELWSEMRAGYDFNFKLSNTNFFVMPQLVIGTGVLSGNKPQSFKDHYKDDEPIFIAPNIAFGIKF